MRLVGRARSDAALVAADTGQIRLTGTAREGYPCVNFTLAGVCLSAGSAAGVKLLRVL